MRVLVVEDNVINMKLIKLVLKRHGHEAIEAVTGREGVAKAEAEKPDLILMDVQLPDMDGLEATRRIRKLQSMKKVPINPLTIMGDIEKIIKGTKS